MTYKEMVEMLDSAGLALFDFDIKGSQAIAFASILKRINAVRNELAAKVEEEVGKE